MRELDFDHVTPFRPITRLNFWILKLLRGYPYTKIHNGVCHIWVGFVISGWDLSNMGEICQIWAPIYYGTVMKYVANNYYMGFVNKVCHISGVSQILQIPTIYDKPLYS